MKKKKKYYGWSTYNKKVSELADFLRWIDEESPGYFIFDVSAIGKDGYYDSVGGATREHIARQYLLWKGDDYL